MAKYSNVGFAMAADTTQLKTLSLAFRRVPPAVRKAAYAALRTEMKIIMADASNRASFSPRITMSMQITGSGLRVRGSAGGGDAWIAVPIENKGEGNILHPVFAKKGSARYADKSQWSDKNSHPAFMKPALMAHRDEVVKVVEHEVYPAILEALRVV